MIQTRQGFGLSLFLLLSLLMLIIAPVQSSAEEDAWAGLDDSLAENSAEGVPLGDEPGEMQTDAAMDSAVKDAEASPELDSSNETLEQRLYREYNDYRARRDAERDEEVLRQRIFHERAQQHFGIDFTFNDLSNFNFGTQVTDATSTTRGVQLHYKRFPLATTTWGRFGIGIAGGAIGTSSKGAHFRLRFINVGPRVSYEALFTTGQVFVPVAFIGYEWIFNRVETPTPDPAVTEDFNTLVLGAGLFVNLNRADPKSGTKGLVALGVRKFDLALLFTQRSGDTDSRSSSAYSAGLRFEY